MDSKRSVIDSLHTYYCIHVRMTLLLICLANHIAYKYGKNKSKILREFQFAALKSALTGTISNRRVLRGSAVILSVSFNYINQVASTSINSVLNHRERLSCIHGFTPRVINFE